MRCRDRFGKYCRPAYGNCRVDLTGRRFGRLVVERSAGFKYWRGQVGARLWKCVCDCKGVTFQPTHALTNGNTNSCGCLHRQKAAAIGHKNRKHGASVIVNGKQVLAPEYISWRSMKMRCLCPNNPSYPVYGGAGITICKRWLGEHGFETFLADLGPRPKGTSLHRKNNKLGYCPSNVVWASHYTQNHERSLSTSEIIRRSWVTRRQNGSHQSRRRRASR